VENVKATISDSVWTRSERKLTNLNDTRAAKIDNLDVAVSTRATNTGIWNYSTRGLTEPVQNVAVMPSDTIRAEANTERSTPSTSYTKLKEFRIFASGVVRIQWEYKGDSNEYIAYTKVYINGTAVSEQYSVKSTTYTKESYDVGVNNGDYIQIYCKTNVSEYPCYIRNVKLCYSILGGETSIPIVTLD